MTDPTTDIIVRQKRMDEAQLRPVRGAGTIAPGKPRLGLRFVPQRTAEADMLADALRRIADA